jgi:N-acyl-D-amino-acid deacylase
MPSDLMRAAEKVHHGTNVAYFIGHSPIRGKVQGFTDDLATPDQLARMRTYVTNAMEAGFLGVSTGLVYAPSVYARTEELIDLMRAAAPYGGVYVSHIRGEGNNCLRCVQEAIRIGEESGCPVFISHIKVMGKNNEGLSEKLLAEIDAANARGVIVHADQYPYTASSAPLSSQIPAKYLLGGKDVWLERIKSPEVRRQILWSIFNEVDEFESGIYHSGFEGALIITAKNTPAWENKTLTEIAAMIGEEKDQGYHTATR